MSSKLARICFLIVTLSILLFAQNVSNLAEKIAIENSFRDKVITAISRIIEKNNFVVIVNVKMGQNDQKINKNPTPQTGMTTNGYSPIPGLPTVPSGNNPSSSGSTPYHPGKKKDEYQITKVDVSIYLEETLATGTATQKIKSLVEDIIPETRDCADCVRIETMQFQKPAEQKAYEELEKKIENLENERRRAERIADSLRYANLTRQLLEAEEARTQWENQSRAREIYQMREDSLRYARLNQMDLERKRQDSLRLVNTSDRLNDEIRGRIESETQTKSELMTIVKRQSGVVEGDEESLLGLQLGNNNSGMTNNIIIIILVLAVVVMGFMLGRSNKPAPIYLKPKKTPEVKEKSKKNKKDESKDDNNAENAENIKDTNKKQETIAMPPAPTRSDEDAARLELKSLRQSAVSLTVGEKDGATKLVKEWLEDNPQKGGDEEESEEG